MRGDCGGENVEVVEVSELLSLRTLACVQCDERFIQEVNEALQHWTLPL